MFRSSPDAPKTKLFARPTVSTESLAEYIEKTIVTTDSTYYAVSLYFLVKYLTIFIIRSDLCLVSQVLTDLHKKSIRLLCECDDPIIRNIAFSLESDYALHDELLDSKMIYPLIGRGGLKDREYSMAIAVLLCKTFNPPEKDFTIRHLFIPFEYGTTVNAHAYSTVDVSRKTLGITDDMPSYWRWVRLMHHVLRMVDRDHTIDATLDMVSSTAYPLDPSGLLKRYRHNTRVRIPFSNYISLLNREYRLFTETAVGFYPVLRESDEENYINYAYQRFFGTADFDIIDYDQASSFLTDAAASGFTPDSNGAYHNVVSVINNRTSFQSISRNNFTELEHRTVAFEANAPDSDMDTDGLATINDPAVDIDNDSTPAEPESPTEPVKTELTSDQPSEDDHTGTPPPDPDAGGFNNNIVDSHTSDNTPDDPYIDLTTPSSSTMNAHLYRRAVLALDHQLTADTTLPISAENRSLLRAWCANWLFIAHVDATKALMRRLKLNRYIKSVD